MALDFPNSPTNNQSFSAGGKTWIYNGTKWVLLGVSLNQTVSDGAITESKIASSAVTSAKIAAGAVGTTDLAANAVTQAKLASNLSAVTVTTSANRGTDVASPFTGQLVFLTDTKKIQVWDGTAWLNITLAPPETPTSLSATALSTTSVSIAFTAGSANGSPITNYKYALSTNSGSTYGAFTAVDPADATSPITISGLTQNTAYYIKLKAVNDMGDSAESAAVTVTTLNTLTVDYLVVAGGGGGGGASNSVSGGAGAGGLRSTVTASGGSPGTVEPPLTLNLNSNYTVTVGAGGAGGVYHQNNGVKGNNSVFSTITSEGGGYGPAQSLNGGNGGSGGGAGNGQGLGFGTGTANQGFDGGKAHPAAGTVADSSGSGGGAGGAGTNIGPGGPGVATSISGSSVTYAGGGGGSRPGSPAGAGGTGGGGAGGYLANGTSGSANTGGGGGGCYGGASLFVVGGAGGSGIVILRYPDTRTITIGAGLTGTESAASGGYKRATITAGSGNVSWT